jgi:hypothetical protein
MIMDGTALLSDLLSATPGWDAQRAAAGLDDTDVRALLDEAARLAAERLAPLAGPADATGCRVEAGRVRTPEGYAAAYAELGAAGWIAPDLPQALGGQDLPLALQSALGLLFDGAALPLMMAAGASRAAARCLAAQAPDLAAEWAPKLASGEWSATICISEPDAGSDLGRIRTRAWQAEDGWRLDGTKCWISFGDHDMTARIGHLALARTGAPQDGTRGLSLFLVPDRDATGARNGVFLERIEAKLGLHGSPTCVLRFDEARASLIGAPGRGLPQLFDMIELMRLQVACQGAGLSLACCAVARSYAQDRRQGGPADAPPPPIASHPDIRRQLTAMETQTAIVTALALDLAAALHQAHEGDAAARQRAAFLLPLAKTFAGETAFSVASAAVQVLGGAGYTGDWPAERHLRDARILTIYEGTTGMQAQDFTLRRLLRDEGAGREAFAAAARQELAACPDTGAAERVRRILDRFEALSAHIAARRDDAEQILLCADAYTRAAWECVSAVLAARLAGLGGDHNRRGHFWLRAASERFAVAEANTRMTRDYLV